VKKWCEESGTGTLSIDPASPWQNGIVESFNGRLRDELLSLEIFDTLAEARYLVERWLLHYNHRRIQRALGRLTPAAFAARCPAEPPLRHRPSRERSLPCSASHKGWTDEIDPVRSDERGTTRQRERSRQENRQIPPENTSKRIEKTL